MPEKVLIGPRCSLLGKIGSVAWNFFFVVVVTTKETLLKEMSSKLKKKREGEENMKGTKDKRKEGKGEMVVGYEFSK